MNRLETKQAYSDALSVAKKNGEELAAMRWLCLNDLFFLLVNILNRADADRDWIFDRCREVAANPNGYLDLWSREHYKSTVITFALTIQDILKNPEITVCLLAYSRPLAKAFLRQIKREFEGNKKLLELFPDILYDNPWKDAPKWSEDDGIIVQRRGNPREATIEAWGLVDGQPTGRHFKLLVYDDTVTKESVTTPEMIAKVTEAWEMSLNLSTEGGKKRYIGTRYHFQDTYQEMMRRGAVIPRVYPGTDDGTINGNPVLFDREWLDERRKVMGSFVFSCQILQNPIADSSRRFDPAWLQYWNVENWEKMNRYIFVDPANTKKKKSDYTAIWVVGYSEDNSFYVIDMVRDRLKLNDRTTALFDLHRKYLPKAVFYEEYGMQADIEHIKYVQGQDNYRFRIIPVGGQISKHERIEGLMPLFEDARVFLPHRIVKNNYENKPEDLVQVFIEQEFKTYPVASHDDMLDCLARLEDEAVKKHLKRPQGYNRMDIGQQAQYMNRGGYDVGPSPLER